MLPIISNTAAVVRTVGWLAKATVVDGTKQVADSINTAITNKIFG